MTPDPTTPSTPPTATPPPAGHRFGFPTLFLAMVVSSAAAGGAVWWFGQGHATQAPESTPAAAEKARYQCPMHPNVVQDHPGVCWICGMTLVKGPDADGGKPAAQASAKVEKKVLFYRAPMDPKVTSPTPAKDPMGMDYLPVYADELAGTGASSVPGQATVDIDPAHQQLIGLTTAPVTTGAVGGAWRTVGQVAMDETRVRHINVKVPGFVEHVYVDFEGKAVKQGDPLFTVYSPELLSAQEEYLLALRTRGALSPSGGAMSADGDTLVKAARRKLALWDISEAAIDRIATAGETTKTLTIYSPVSGVVTKKDVVEGMKLEAGAMPYEIVDLSTVWVLADVYESELRFIKEGMPATLTLNAFPNRQFTGKVLFMDPLLDPKTRTIKVRLSFPNSSRDMRPGMFGEVVLHGQPREGLRIPQDAVVDSGTEKIVFVTLGNGKFQPRIVRLGDSSGNDVEVISGLKQGEEVVTRANFLVDSESKLRASLAEMTGGPPVTGLERARVLPGTGTAPTAPPPPPDSGPSAREGGHAP